MGVSLGSKSLIGGVIFYIPMTFTIALSPPNMLPSTSGYSSPKLSYRLTPSFPNFCSSPHLSIDMAILETKSAACCLTLADLFASLCTMYAQI